MITKEQKEQWPEFNPEKHYLVRSCADFIVFLDEDLDVDWLVEDSYTESEKYDAAISNRVLAHAAIVETIPNKHLITDFRQSFKRMIGEALACGFVKRYDDARRLLENAEVYVQERNREISRYWLLSAATVACLLFLIVLAPYWLFRSVIMSLSGQLAFFVGLAAVAGATGAWLSVFLRLGHVDLDGAAGRKLHYVEGALKIVCGAFAAVLVALAVKAGILLPVFSKVDDTYLAMVIAGFVAGASERLAPSFIARVEGESETLTKGKPPKGPQENASAKTK